MQTTKAFITSLMGFQAYNYQLGFKMYIFELLNNLLSLHQSRYAISIPSILYHRKSTAYIVNTSVIQNTQQIAEEDFFQFLLLGAFHILGLDCKLPAWVQSLLALLLGGLDASLPGRELAAFGAGKLGAKVLGLVLLAIIELPQVLLLCLVHHSEHTSDGFAHIAAGTHKRKTHQFKIFIQKKGLCGWHLPSSERKSLSRCRRAKQYKRFTFSN